MQDRLNAYAELLRAYAPKLNLVSLRDLDHLEERHFDDSLRLLPLLETLPEGPCIDVGSGAGLPGVPLACGEPDRQWILLEPRVKRAAFLEEVVRTLGLKAEVVCKRAEDAIPAHGGRYVLAAARALAEPPQALELIRPFLRDDGRGAIFLGARSRAPAGAEVWTEGIAIVRPMAHEHQST